MTFEKTYLSLIVFLTVFSGATAHAASVSDFSADVQKGLSGILPDTAAGSIKTQDYKTSWDEFGTNVLADGVQPTAEIQKALIEDITRDLQMQVAYDQKDAQYLEVRKSSPEEVTAVESAGGSDVLPENYIEPHPSLDANPDVNPSALDVTVSTIETPITIDTSQITPATGETTILPDNLLPPDGAWKPADITVFETIVNTDTAVTPTETSATPVDATVTPTDTIPPSPDIATPSDIPPVPEPAPEPAPAPDTASPADASPTN